MGDGLHDVLRMRFGQPHVPRRAPAKPSAHGAKRAPNPASRPADPRVELLLARHEPLSADLSAYDAILALLCRPIVHLLSPVVHSLVLLAVAGSVWNSGDARIDDGSALNHEPLGLQLPVDLVGHLVKRASLGHGVAEPKHRGAVGRGRREALPYESTGGDAVIPHLLHPLIAQAVPNAQELNLEKHEPIIARAARRGATRRVHGLDDGPHRLSVYNPINLRNLGQLGPPHLRYDVEEGCGTHWLFCGSKLLNKSNLDNTF